MFCLFCLIILVLLLTIHMFFSHIMLNICRLWICVAGKLCSTYKGILGDCTSSLRPYSYTSTISKIPGQGFITRYKILIISVVVFNNIDSIIQTFVFVRCQNMETKFHLWWSAMICLQCLLYWRTIAREQIKIPLFLLRWKPCKSCFTHFGQLEIFCKWIVYKSFP
jgi:hypothetical protein